MELRTEKEVLIDDLNRANKLLEETTLDYMNMCKRVEVLEKYLNEIEKICNENKEELNYKKDEYNFALVIIQLIKQVKESE